MEKIRHPDFFIVGAPKSGTTSLNNQLSQHPEVFMAPKEMHYFGTDLEIKNRTSKEKYFGCFENVSIKKICGEASVWYLYSAKAAEEIKKANPQAKIIIMLRNPVEMAHSLHSQNIYDCYEDIKDFEKALSLEAARKKGNNIPPSNTFKQALYYTDAAMYATQVKRYLDIFGKDKVHIILFNDFIKNNQAEFSKVLSFLGLKEFGNINFSVSNPNKTFQNQGLHQIIKNPPTLLKRIFRILMPFKKVRATLIRKVYEANIKEEKREKISQKLKSELSLFFNEDLTQLAKIIDKDLTCF